MPKIFDGKFYELLNSIDASGNINAKCTACDEIRKGNVSSTGNFMKHYQLKHPLKLNELKLHNKVKENSKQPNQPAIGNTYDVRILL